MEEKVGSQPNAPSSSKRITPKFTENDSSSEVFCVRFSPDSTYIAAGCGNGAIKIFNTQTGKQAYALNVIEGGMPTTCLRWRPQQAQSKTKNVLISVNADGVVQHWHITSGKCLHQIADPDNQLYCIDYRSDGMMFATAGKNREIHVYDEATKRIATTLVGGDHSTPGHSNRVFSLKFMPDDENIIVTGGWDNTIQLWDIRVGHAFRGIYGPHICGDAVDVQDQQILSGSWRLDNQLQLWDFGTGKLVETIKWKREFEVAEPCLLYAAQFSKGVKGMIMAGGSGSNEAKLFDTNAGNACFGTITGMTRACYSVDFSHDSSMVATAGGDGSVRVFGVSG